MKSKQLFAPIEMQDKSGRTVILRSVEVSDASDLVEYMNKTAEETKFLLREPNEF